MAHDSADFWEAWHHFWYRFARGYVHESQYVGTVKMSEEELEETLFHETDARYNWLAYWKYHMSDGRNSEGSWKLRWPRHDEYVDQGKQIHITLFPSRTRDDWLDIYAHYEYDNIAHPIKHFREHGFSANEGVKRCRRYFLDNKISLYELH